MPSNDIPCHLATLAKLRPQRPGIFFQQQTLDMVKGRSFLQLGDQSAEEEKIASQEANIMTGKQESSQQKWMRQKIFAVLALQSEPENYSNEKEGSATPSIRARRRQATNKSLAHFPEPD